MSESVQEPTHFGQSGLGFPITEASVRWGEQVLEKLSTWEQQTRAAKRRRPLSIRATKRQSVNHGNSRVSKEPKAEVLSKQAPCKKQRSGRAPDRRVPELPSMELPSAEQPKR